MLKGAFLLLEFSFFCPKYFPHGIYVACGLPHNIIVGTFYKNILIAQIGWCINIIEFNYTCSKDI